MGNFCRGGGEERGEELELLNPHAKESSAPLQSIPRVLNYFPVLVCFLQSSKNGAKRHSGHLYFFQNFRC
jgi:hypothetical protein